MVERWSADELEVLRSNYFDMEIKEFQHLLPNRSYSGIRAKSKALGFKRRSWWTPEELQLLEVKYPSATKEELLSLFDRHPWASIQDKAKDRGLKRDLHFVVIRKKPVKNLELSDVDVGYVTAFLDGEGSISLKRERRGHKHYKAKLYFANTHKPVLEWLKEKLGGCLYQMSKSKHEGCTPCYMLEIEGLRHIPPILKVLLPHLKVKRRHAELMLAWCESRLSHKRVNHPYTEDELKIASELRSLSAKGPEGFKR